MFIVLNNDNYCNIVDAYENSVYDFWLNILDRSIFNFENSISKLEINQKIKLLIFFKLI